MGKSAASHQKRTRLRASPLMRDLVNEAEWTPSQLIQPLFVGEGLTTDLEIPGLLGTKRQSEDSILRQIDSDLEAGVRQFILFSIPAEKRERGFDHSFTNRMIAALKKRTGDQALLWVDTCLCSVTTHGHCCVFHSEGERRGGSGASGASAPTRARVGDPASDPGPEIPEPGSPAHRVGHIAGAETLAELARLAQNYAEAGADGVSPSDMMDGRVGAMRERLDAVGFEHLPIMSYSTKFASSMYGPFRVAADSSPKHGDRKGYQIDVRNRTDAIHSSIRCAEEGADLLMVKPGMTSIDLIRDIHRETGKPVGAYQVSGEYAGLVLLAREGLTDLPSAMKESWQVFRRAGAQYIITYGARFAREWGMTSW